MISITSIINQKGGVGKSTTSHALGAGLLARGFRVLFVDLDAQANLSFSAGVEVAPLSSLDVLLKRCTAKEAVQRINGCPIIPGSPGLSGADMLLNETGKEYRLREQLLPLEHEYDYIVIDTPPALGILTVNALTACTDVIIPSQADIYSLQGIGQLYGTINTVKQYTNANININGILLTRFNQRAILSRDIASLIQDTAKELDTSLYRSGIREGIAIKEAQASRRSIFDYAPKSNAAQDYDSFVDEYLKRGEEKWVKRASKR